MRKLLLATAAVLGAAPGLALAQTSTNPIQGQFISSPVGGAAANTVSNYGPGGSGTAKPTPGTIVIKLNGRVEVDMDASWQTGNALPNGSAKVNPVAFGSYMRLYPAVDGLAANGLRYGASIELRENFPGGSAQTTPAMSPAPSGSTYTSGETVFVRRAFTYLGADNVGIIRFGQGDGVIGMLDNGTFSSQGWDAGAGNFNGGPLQSQGPGAGIAIPFAWLAQAGAEYGNTKVVYLSPNFAGFDFALQYAPGMGNGNSGCGGAGASPACTLTTTGSDSTRWYNQVAIGGRYQGTFGPMKLGAMAVYETAGKETLYGTPVTATTLAPTAGARSAASATSLKYDNLSFAEAALYATMSTGMGDFTASADWIGGALNGQLSMRPQGGVPEEAVVAGLLYKNGPWTLGAEAAFVNSQGDARLAGLTQRREYEAAFGGNYTPAPGLYLVAEYMYEHRHQGLYDFVAGGISGTTRDAQAQGVMFSTIMTW
jgi:hypothetical protein